MSGSVMKIKRAPLGDVRQAKASTKTAVNTSSSTARGAAAKENNSQPRSSSSSRSDDDITVEEYLEQQCQLIMKDVQEHAKEKIADLKAEYATGRKQIEKMLVQNTDTNTKLCVTLKVNTGPHLGQKFRLELTEGKTEDTFRLGRSGAKLYKEKGVSLYKDKEVSTTHARIEIRNGEAFYIDTRSTNGSSLNGMRVEVNVPYNIKEGDMLSIGASECSVSIAASDGPEEDFASV